MVAFKPRLDSIRVLSRVLGERQPLDEALEEIGQASQAPQYYDDKQASAWLQEVCSGTLRWKGILDLILDSIAHKKKPSGWLRKALLVATYQVVVQDRAPIPQVVNETVSLVREKEGDHPARFANACLRRIAQDRGTWRGEGGFQSKAFLKASLPPWLWKKCVRDWGEAWAFSYAEKSLERPTTWMRSRQDGSSLPGLPELPRLDNPSDSPQTEWVEGPILGSRKVIQSGRVTGISGFQEGKLIVQDISSQTLILEVTQKIQEERGKGVLKALDLCAAPGGKSVGLAWNGFNVTATDKNSHRIPRLLDTVSRAGAGSSLHVKKWEEVMNSADLYDLIWVDAPCSGTGILRRHPEIRWLRREKELDSLKQTQEELIRVAWARLSPGGYLVYSVCSVLKEEGEGAVERAGLTQATEIQRWFLCPQEAPHGDGFWGILLRKSSS